jgi:hypothetical protein
MSNTLDPSLVITPFRPDDYERWLPLWRGYQSFYRTDIPDETTQVTWRRMMDPAEPMWGALARVAANPDDGFRRACSRTSTATTATCRTYSSRRACGRVSAGR